MTFLTWILVLLLGLSTIFNFCVETLNLKAMSPQLPEEFKGVYDPGRYKRSQEYLNENTKLELLRSLFMSIVLITFVTGGGFGLLDAFFKSRVSDLSLRGLFYIASLGVANWILGAGFELYRVFHIEQKYEFNRMTLKIWFLDQLKVLLISLLLGVPLLLIVFWIFQSRFEFAWLWAWGGVGGFQILVLLVAPVLILPLFNKFTPIESGELKDAILRYASSQGFEHSGIFTMDGSRRTNKANAFFTGFGRFRKIALYDTLIAKLSTAQVMGVLAHEIGHYRKKHVHKSLLISWFSLGLMFWIFSFFLEWHPVFEAFAIRTPSVYAGLAVFGFFFSPLSRLISVLTLALSRRHEFEADRFAVQTTALGEEFISALKKLSVDNLSNLTPHPWKVFLEYSHPPVLKRIEAIRSR